MDLYAVKYFSYDKKPGLTDGLFQCEKEAVKWLDYIFIFPFV